jgi:KRAB domain-containing zinc finger protein
MQFISLTLHSALHHCPDTKCLKSAFLHSDSQVGRYVAGGQLAQQVSTVDSGQSSVTASGGCSPASSPVIIGNFNEDVTVCKTQNISEQKIHLVDTHKCETCHKSFKKHRYLDSHMRLHFGNKRLSGTFCSKRFVRSTQLHLHLHMHSGDTVDTGHSSATSSYDCSSTSRPVVIGHFNEELSVHQTQDNSEQQVDLDDNAHKCETCHKSFKKRRYLDTHMRLHLGDKPFLCTLCNKRFSRSSNLTLHLRTHSGDKPYTCDMCTKAFSSRGGLTSHMRAHTGEKPFRCNVCNLCFTHFATLYYHKRRHTGNKPYTCVICNKSFCRRETLSTHERMHAGNTPYTCDICSKKFVQSSQLIRHKRTHTGERPYICDVCSSCFKSTGNLRNHIRTHTGEKPYTCDTCGLSFARKYTLKIHRRTHQASKCENI